MIYLAYTIHIVVCLFLILVVLLQQGKGADLSVFGGGSTQTAFGARGAATLLHKMTVGSFIAFIVTTMAIGFLQAGDRGSVMGTLPEEPLAAPAEPTDETAAQAAEPAAESQPPAPVTPEESTDGDEAPAAGETDPPQPQG